MEVVVEAAGRACTVRFGQGLSMENLESRHRAIDRGNGVGIETVAGFAEEVEAGAWRIKFTKAGDSGEKVKGAMVRKGAVRSRV